jgi:UDPglucose--hexose-1-phosphate uridylyltransferase
MREFELVLRDGVEYRFDPLTGGQTRINPDRARRPRQAQEDLELEGIIERSRKACVFCPEMIEQNTPTFPETICTGGRIRRGETVVFPNLNPFGENHVVATLSKAHFLDLDEFRVELLRDNLLASRQYILSVWKNDKEARWPIWVWNYMPPSAGSIIHPHVQILVEGRPVPQLAELMARGKAYFDERRSNYWEDLISEEQRLDERYLFGDDAIAVIASFAPRGFHEIQFIFHRSSLAEMSEGEIDAFAHALTKALAGYKAMGIGSFNLITYSGPLHEDLASYRLHARLFSRPYPRGVYTNDTGPMERGYDVWVIDTVPEGIADRMKPFFL